MLILKCIIYLSNQSTYSVIPPVYSYFGSMALQVRKLKCNISTVGRKQFKVKKNIFFRKNGYYFIF